MELKRVSSILEKMPEQRVNSKSFNEVFQIDGIPLWRFLELLMDSYLPKPFKPSWEIENDIKSGRTPSSLDGAKFSLSSFAVRKGLALNEGIKLFISRMDKKSGKAKKIDVLFIGLTSPISKKNDKLRFLEFGKIVNCLKKNGIKPLTLICDPFSKNSFFKLRRYKPLLYEYITPQIIRESKRMSNELHKRWKGLDENILVKVFSWRGRNYLGFFKKDFDLLFSKEMLFTLIKYYLTFKHILETHDVKAIYSTSFGGFYGVSALGAVYKLNKRIVYSPHGYGGIPNRKHEFMKNVFFAAGGIKDKNRLLREGMRENKLL